MVRRRVVKKKFLWWVFCLTLALGSPVFCGDLGPLYNPFTPGTVSIKLTEPSFKPDCFATPGAEIEKDPVVTNTGTTGIWVFMKVTIPVREMTYLQGDSEISTGRVAVFSFVNQKGWTEITEDEDENDNEVKIYAYSQALEPGETTPPLFDSLITVKYREDFAEIEAERQQTVKVEAFAVQKQAEGTFREIYDQYFPSQGDMG